MRWLCRNMECPPDAREALASAVIQSSSGAIASELGLGLSNYDELEIRTL